MTHHPSLQQRHGFLKIENLKDGDQHYLVFLVCVVRSLFCIVNQNQIGSLCVSDGVRLSLLLCEYLVNNYE